MNPLRPPRNRHRAATVLATVAGVLLPLTQARAADNPDDFIETATIEELDKAGYLLHGASDLDARMVNLMEVLDMRHAAIAELAEAGFSQYAAELAQFGAIADLSSTLQIVDYLPSPTGQAGAPSIVMDLDDLGAGPDLDGLGASLPSKGGLASQDSMSLVNVEPDGTQVWTKDGTDEFGNSSGEMIWVRDGTITRARAYRMDAEGNGVTIDERLEEDGSRTRTFTKYHHNEPTAQHTENVPEGAEPPPLPAEYGSKGKGKGDIAKLPAEDESATYCPLYLPACRAAAEDAEESGSLVYLVSQTVFVNPGPDGGKDEPEGSNVVSDPDPFATNPDPNALSGEYAPMDKAMELQLPVIVLPPKPSV